jgi:hypothetical protein
MNEGGATGQEVRDLRCQDMPFTVHLRAAMQCPWWGQVQKTKWRQWNSIRCQAWQI